MSRLDIGGRTLTRNAALNFAGLGVPLLVALVVVPRLLTGMGEGGFGLLGLVWMFVMLFGEMGFGRAGTRFAADALGAGDSARVPRVARVVLGAQLLLGAAVGAVIVVVAGVLSDRVLSMEPGLVPEARRSFVYLGLALPVLTLGAGYRGLLEAAQRFGGLNVVRLIANSLNYLAPLAGLAAGWSVSAIVGVLMLLRLAMAAAYAVLSRDLWRRAPVTATGPGTWEILGFGAWITVSTVVSPVLVYLDRFLLGALVSVAAVGIYTAPYELVTRILLIPGSIATTVFPAVSALAGSGDHRRLQRVRRGAWLATLALVGPVALVFAVAADPLLTLWLGPSATPEAVRALQFLAPGVVLNALAHIPFSVLQGIGRADVTARIHLVELPIHAVLAWFLIGRWGVAGAAAAWSARVALDAALLTLSARALMPRPAGAPA